MPGTLVRLYLFTPFVDEGFGFWLGKAVNDFMLVALVYRLRCVAFE